MPVTRIRTGRVVVGLLMDEVLRKAWVENQSGIIRSLGQLLNLPSNFLKKQLEKETLKIICERSILKPRQVRRYDRVVIVKEVPAGRWGVVGQTEKATQTPPLSLSRGARQTQQTAVRPLSRQAPQ